MPKGFQEERWEDVRYPFGKHKGELLRDIPNTYLEWALEEGIEFHNPLMTGHIEDRLAKGYYVEDEQGR